MKGVRFKGIDVAVTLFMLCVSLFHISFVGVSMVSAETATNSVHLTEAEQSWLRAHPVIRLAPDPAFKPIEFFNEQGVYDGIGADYVRLIEKKLGIAFDIVHCRNWEDVIARAKNREIDVLNAVVKTPQREKFLLFPPPYLTIPSVIIVRQNVSKELTLDMLSGLRVVMVAGYGYVDVVRNTYPDIQIELVLDLKTALTKVSFGMTDAFIGDLATASYYIEQQKITNLKLAGEFEPQNISGFAVRSDWPELGSILEKGVALLTENERKNIHQKWIQLAPPQSLTKNEVTAIILVGVVIIVLIAAVFFLWNRILNRKVRQRTADLNNQIDERIQIEEALRESEKRFSDLCTNSTDWIWEFDENEIFTYASPRCKDLLGIEPEAIIGQSAYDPMSSTDAARVMHAFSRFKKAKKPFSHLVNETRHTNGSTVILESSGVPIIDRNGTFRGYRGIDRDITKRTQLEAQLRQAYKMEAIGTLAGGIAHDFNNILTAIIGYAEMAQVDISEKSRSKKYVQEVLKASTRAKELVKQILTFSRKNQATPQPLQPYLIVKEALKLMRASLPTTIEIQENIDAESGLIMANSTNIHQIVVNLFTNALHAMQDEQGVITISLKKVVLTEADVINDDTVSPGSFVEFVVSDTGHGMDQETVDRIFEPYFTTKEVDKGSGIGLAVVHGIIQSCNGCIKVDSAPNKGTTFKVFFPALVEKETDNKQKQRPTPLAKGNERILVIDDEKTITNLYKEILKKQGYTVNTLCSSAQALAVFTMSPDNFDLIITDQTMPHLPGSELSRKMLQIRADIPIILCTGYNSTISEKKAKAIGIKKFVLKPINSRDLVTIVREVLDTRQLPAP